MNENGHTLMKFDWDIWKWMPMTMKWMTKDETNENGFNGTASFKNVNNCLNTNIYSYLETSVDQSSNLCSFFQHQC